MENKIPQQVGAVKVHKYGTPPVFEAEKLPSKLADTDVIIKIQAAGVTHFDLLLMSGKIPYPVQFPYIPGTDCVGRVVAAGKSAQPILGRRVIIVGGQGTWAEYIPHHMHQVIPIDDDVPVQCAAYGFSNPFTAIGLLSQIRNQKRKGIVIDAAASALGKMINKLARKQKIPVINVVRKKQHQQSLKKEGLQNIVVTEGDWKPKYDALVKSSGADTLIDSLGSGDVLDKLMKGLPTGGLVIIISVLDGGKPIVDMNSTQKVKTDKYTLQPWTLFNWFKSITPEDQKNMGKAHSQRLKNQLSTVVSQTFKFKDIGKAIEAAKTNCYKGKILLVP